MKVGEIMGAVIFAILFLPVLFIGSLLADLQIAQQAASEGVEAPSKAEKRY